MNRINHQKVIEIETGNKVSNTCDTPGMKVKSEGKGQGLGKGEGKGPIGVPIDDEEEML